MATDASIPLQGVQPNPTNYISGFLDLGQKKLNLDKARATFNADVAQRNADSSSAQSAATMNAANVNPLIQQQQAQTETSQTGAASAKFRLQGEQAQRAREMASAFLQDPDFKDGNQEGMIQKLSEARQFMIQSGVPPAVAEANSAFLINKAFTDPKSVRGALATMVQQGVGAQGQAGQNLVPAGAQQQVSGTDVRGNPVMQVRDQFGSVSQSGVPQAQGQPQPVQAGAPAPIANAPLQFPAGENQGTYKLLNDEREASRTTVNQAPTIHALNKEIISELGHATTGQYSGLIAKAQSIGGMMGLSLTGSNELERAASAYDLIDKYTTQAATRAAQSMGNDTATALNAQLKQNASVERNPTAIKKSILFNDAVLSGAEAYQGGLERSIQANPQADLFIKRKFDQEWAKNFDPVIMQIYNAKKSGDTAELSDINKGLGDRKESIMKKAARLQELSQRGL
jgi:hypothetical protein